MILGCILDLYWYSFLDWTSTPKNKKRLLFCLYAPYPHPHAETSLQLTLILMIREQLFSNPVAIREDWSYKLGPNNLKWGVEKTVLYDIFKKPILINVFFFSFDLLILDAWNNHQLLSCWGFVSRMLLYKHNIQVQQLIWKQ